MKIFIDRENYIEVKKDKAEGQIRLSIKAKKDNQSSVLVTALMSAEQAEKLISELVTIRAKL
jgi:predicted metal-binding transcription factor (methanogenesis marker protein 9)